MSECASVHNLRGHRGCALASVGPAADKVPVNGKCYVGFRKGLGAFTYFYRTIGSELAELALALFENPVLCVMNTLCCLGLGFYLFCVQAYIRLFERQSFCR